MSLHRLWSRPRVPVHLLIVTGTLLCLASTTLVASQQESTEDPVVLQRLGILYIEQNQPAEAIQVLRRAVDYMPENGEAHMWLGFAYYLSGEFALAEESYLRALNRNPTLTEVHNYLGLLRVQEQKYDEAIGEFEVALRDPAFPPTSKARVLTNLAKVQLELGELEQALSHARQATDLVGMRTDPAYPLAYQTLGNVLYQIGRKEEAISAIERALEVQPENAGALLTLGLSQRDMGLTEDACTTLREVVRAAPGSAVAERAQTVRAQLDC